MLPSTTAPTLTLCNNHATGESLNDLAATLLPTAALTAYLARRGVVCDCEDYYISDIYTRDPAQYRPDGLAVQCNLSLKR